MEVQTHRRTVQRSREEMTGSADKPSDLSEVCGHHIEKHPAWQPHISGCPQANQKRKSIQEGKDRKLTPVDLLGGFTRRSRSKKIVNHNNINAPENSDFHEELPAKSSASQPPFPKRCHASGKKKRKQKDEETSDLHEELLAKSSASQPPFPKRCCASGKKKCKQKDEETNDLHEELPAKSSASQPPFPKRCRAFGKKKRKQKDEETSDLHEELPAKSSASQPPFPKRCRAFGKKKRKQKDEETSDPEVVKRSLGRERSKRRVNCDNGIVPQQGKLDSSVFECYLENLWMSFSEEKRSSFTYLDCLWFSLYTKESYKAKVLDWITKKQIFSKKYVFVPIVRWCHWSLLIFCNFGESPQTKSRTPCMLLLDSLQIANPQRLEPEIRKFVLDIYKAEERPEIKKQISRIPLKIPKVPQQRNAEECGNFVLYYINLFIESAPENFSISEGYPYFMKKDWFTPEGLECFCKRFDSI